MKFLKSCKIASREIIKLIHSSNKSIFDKINKGFGGDISMNIDLLAEQIFINYFSKFGNIYSEECGLIDNKKEITFIIDPIDGSFNISNAFPYYGSSVAVKKGDEIIKSFVINLATGDYFYKSKNRRIENNLFYNKKVTPSMNEIILFEKAYANIDICQKLAENSIKYRSPGALALSIALAHRCKAVIFKGDIREFDIAAGLHFNNNLNIKIEDNIILIAKKKKEFNKLSKILF